MNITPANRLASALGCAALLVLLSVAPPSAAQSNESSQQTPAPKQGCPYPEVTQKVKAIFGNYDRVVSNADMHEAAEALGGMLKAPSLAMTTCSFLRKGSERSGETLQFIAFSYTNPEEAAAAFGRAAATQSSGTLFYTSGRRQGDIQMAEGPGRALCLWKNQLVKIQWMQMHAGRGSPKNVPGSVLSPVAVAYFKSP